MSKPTFYIKLPYRHILRIWESWSSDVAKAIVEMDKYDVKILPQRWGATPWGFIEDHEEDWGFLTKHFLTLNLINNFLNLTSGCK